MRIDPQRPEWEERDRFILSKGHAAPVYYAALPGAASSPRSCCRRYDELDSLLQAHPDMRCPGVDMSSGSLGQGLSVGPRHGARRATQRPRLRGSSCCSATASCRRARSGRRRWRRPSSALDNLVAIVDDNRVQLMGDTANVMPVEPIADKWRAFNWQVLEVDGHDVDALVDACAAARARRAGPRSSSRTRSRARASRSWRTRTRGTAPRSARTSRRRRSPSSVPGRSR